MARPEGGGKITAGLPQGNPAKFGVTPRTVLPWERIVESEDGAGPAGEIMQKRRHSD
jgi:hypothetical protein